MMSSYRWGISYLDVIIDESLTTRSIIVLNIVYSYCRFDEL